MEKEELQELFCAKLSLEYDRFREKVLLRTPEQIYQAAYQIECMESIYKILVEMSRKIEREEFIKLLFIPELLGFLYGRWLKYQDSFAEELWDCMEKEITKIGETKDSEFWKGENKKYERLSENRGNKPGRVA